MNPFPREPRYFSAFTRSLFLCVYRVRLSLVFSSLTSPPFKTNFQQSAPGLFHAFWGLQIAFTTELNALNDGPSTIEAPYWKATDHYRSPTVTLR